jgi:hypothetical protein
MTRSSLFSAVSITFIVSLRSALSPDETEMTNALVKLLIYTLDSTAFDGRQPTLPHNGMDQDLDTCTPVSVPVSLLHWVPYWGSNGWGTSFAVDVVQATSVVV